MINKTRSLICVPLTCVVLVTILSAPSTHGTGVRLFTEDLRAQIETWNRDAPPGEQIVCRRTRVTGSHIKRRVCQTQREWDAYHEESIRTAEHLQDMSSRPSFRP